MSQQHQGLLRGPHVLCFHTAYKWPNLNQIHQPLKPHVLPVAPRVPGPQHSPCAGGDASAPCLVPLWAQMSSRLWKGQQSSARRSRWVSSEPFFLSVAVGLVYAHRAPERLFSNLGRGCGGSDVVPLPCLPGRLLPGRVPAGEGLRGESPSRWNPAACAASCFLCFLCACFPRKL